MKEIDEFIKKIKSKHIDFAVIKLSSFYVLIIMVISVSFSISIYKISARELDRGLGSQVKVFRDIQISGLPFGFQNLEQARISQLEESNRKIRNNLTYFNLLILAFSSILSYYFAKKTLEPIEKTMEAQNRFTADASHELRTPLTAMKTEIEVALRDRKLNLNSSKELLKSNLEEIAKLESLSSALLKLAKNEDLSLSLQNINLDEVITEAYEKVASFAEEREIEFETNLGDSSRQDSNKVRSLIIKGDRQSLVELFVILLDNAIKYSPKHSKIFITTKKAGDGAIVTIEDQGLGIKASDLPHIFDRFYRADQSRNKDKVAGFGLGLSIAKQIIDLHNGTITVTSKPDKGSEFKVTL